MDHEPNLGTVFLTRLLPEEPVSRLQERTRLTYNRQDRPLTRDELLEGVRDAEGLLCLVTDRIDEDLLASAPRLRVIANYAVGFDNIDLAAATRRGIAVTNTPDVLTAATADMAFALLLAVSRRVIEGDALVWSSRWRGWVPQQLLGSEVTAATLGFIGLGRIGRAVARRLVPAHDGQVLDLRQVEPLGEERLGLIMPP